MSTVSKQFGVSTEKFPSRLEPSLMTAQVVIEAAEVKTLAASPVTLVPAPGPGRILLFADAYIRLEHGGTDYDDAAADGDIAIRYTDGSGTIVSTTLDADTFVDATGDAHRSIKQLTTDITVLPNAALVLDNTGDEFTGGNGRLIVTVFYYNLFTGL